MLLSQGNEDKRPQGLALAPRRSFRIASFIAVLALMAVLTSLFTIKGRYYPHGSVSDVNGAADVAALNGASASQGQRLAKVSELPPGDHRLTYILPADNSGPSLCKVIFSGMALGYPSPVVVNWGKNYQDLKLGGPHLTKITGALEYLDAMSHESVNNEDRLEDNDLVVLVDAYDVWWQLPPDVLIQRYDKANRAANERLARHWGVEGNMPMQQTIIASVQKKCWPSENMPSKLHCDILPDSPARKDLYGKATDTPPEKSTNQVNEFHDVRPKYLNSGTIIGPVGDMKRYLRRVQERMYRTVAVRPDLWSDQGVFAEILGEQELWRTWIRKIRQKGGLPGDEAFSMASDEFELHVGLDYAQELFIPTVFEEEDGDIVTLNNETYITERSRELGIKPVRLKGVPEDVRQAEHPLKRIAAQNRHTGLDWGEMPLYADFFSEAVPVAVHHNAHRDGLKRRNVSWWNRMWYFPYLRPLVKSYLSAPEELKPLVTLSTRAGDATYWPLDSEKTRRKPRMFTLKDADKGLPEMEFNVLCSSQDEKPWHEEIFRDGAGPI